MNECMPIVGRRMLCAVTVLFLFGTQAAAVKPKKKKAHSGPVFGTPEPIPGALRGTIYRLTTGSSHLPDFSRLRPSGVVYTTALDYILQPCDDEWFGIEYEGTFYVTKPGDYRFQLTADDGAQLFIDGKRMIDKDGVHAAEAGEEIVRLEAGGHKLRVPYFQGPRPYVALVLEVKPPGGKTRTFDTDDFQPPLGASGADAPESRPTVRRK